MKGKIEYKQAHPPKHAKTELPSKCDPKIFTKTSDDIYGIEIKRYNGFPFDYRVLPDQETLELLEKWDSPFFAKYICKFDNFEYKTNTIRENFNSIFVKDHPRRLN